MAHKPLLRHLVLFTFRETISATEIATVEAAFRQLPQAIAAIADLEWGQSINTTSAYQYSLIVSFYTKADLEDYHNHPAHQSIATTYGLLIQQVVVGDYWMKGENVSFTNISGTDTQS
jgi:Stress responsive A/B Barrel Domain